MLNLNVKNLGIVKLGLNIGINYLDVVLRKYGGGTYGLVFAKTLSEIKFYVRH